MLLGISKHNIAYVPKRENDKVQQYKLVLYAIVITGVPAVLLTILRAVLIATEHNDFGITILQQSAIGLALAAITTSSTLIIGIMNKTDRSNNGKSDSSTSGQ